MRHCLQRWQFDDGENTMISDLFQHDVLIELNEISITLRVFLSILVGGILGIERGSKNRPAGFRTYILVCLGASLVMMTNQFVFKVYGASDPTRLGAQVISGIGFLGAGTIILNGRNQVKGVTTAACLWTAACCGLAIGVGFYFGAIIGAVSTLFVLTTLHKIDLWMRINQSILMCSSNIIPRRHLSASLSNLQEVTDLRLKICKSVRKRRRWKEESDREMPATL